MIDSVKQAKTTQLRERWFHGDVHPYRQMETLVRQALRPESTLLDAGCGRTAPTLVGFRGQAARLIGIDCIEMTQSVAGCELYRRDLESTGLPDNSVDVIYSRSVFEHLERPGNVLQEFRRILSPGGRCVILTASLWDYATLVSMLIPNRFHPYIVSRTEGRAAEDVFPARYRCNTRGRVLSLAKSSGLDVEDFRYAGQYPAYFAFSPVLFSVASMYELAVRQLRPLHPLLGWILFTLRKPAARTSDSLNSTSTLRTN